jgi:MFS family permease
MHPTDEPSPPNPMPSKSAANTGPWYHLLSRYHWFVLVVAALGWLFDCLDQQLFILARPAAMKELVESRPDESQEKLEQRRRASADVATSLFIAGWAAGGLFFGMLGDRIGRAKTMMITILLYSACTGLSALSVGVWDFAFYRFLTGLGVGGEFAVGVALVAEVMPALARPYALGLLQALSAFGNIAAAFINLGLGIAASEAEGGLPTSPWRIMFLIGALPALLALVVRLGLKEPEQWQKIAGQSRDETGIREGEPPIRIAAQPQLGSYAELFRDPVWRKHAICGLILGCSGIIGLWSIGFFVPDLTGYIQRKSVAAEVYAERIEEAKNNNDEELARKWTTINEHEQARKMPKLSPELKKLQKDEAEEKIGGILARWGSYASLMINIGAFFGIYGFGLLAQWIGRKISFVIALSAAFVSTAAVCLFLQDFWQMLIMVPIMGFCQLSLFGGYAIYFPELFPTRLRSTGTSFCYNVGRFFAALGPLVKTVLEGFFQSSVSSEAVAQDPVIHLRYAGVTMCLVFLVGFFVLPFLPETKGQPLPE